MYKGLLQSVPHIYGYFILLYIDPNIIQPCLDVLHTSYIGSTLQTEIPVTHETKLLPSKIRNPKTKWRSFHSELGSAPTYMALPYAEEPVKQFMCVFPVAQAGHNFLCTDMACLRKNLTVHFAPWAAHSFLKNTHGGQNAHNTHC